MSTNPDTAKPVEALALRTFAGHFATGITVLTTRDASGRDYGLTMNAVSNPTHSRQVMCDMFVAPLLKFILGKCLFSDERQSTSICSIMVLSHPLHIVDILLTITAHICLMTPPSNECTLYRCNTHHIERWTYPHSVHS